MFSLTRAKVRIIAVTAVSELHGAERKPACCITFEMTASNVYLAEFHELLRSMLYSRETQPSRQGTLDIDPEADGLTALRFPQMGLPIKWDWEGAGYEAHFHIGASGKGDIVLEGVDLRRFQFTPKDGGSCVYTWQAMTHPTAKDQGQIDQMLQSDVELSLVEPHADADLLEEGDRTGAQPSSTENASPFPDHECQSMDEPPREDPFANTDLARGVVKSDATVETRKSRRAKADA